MISRFLTFKSIARIAFLLACGALLGFGLLKEKHIVQPLTTQGSASLRSGLDFIADTTIDRYMLRDGQLVDIYSLSGNVLGLKDCKT